MEKVRHQDSSIPPKVALTWVVSAYTNLTNIKGFPPALLVFSDANKLPTLYTAGPAGLEEVKITHQVSQHILALHLAREAFIQCEAD